MRVIDMVSIADVFTVLNALLGFSAIIVALEGEMELAYILVIMGVLADGLDGMVARRFGSRWNIGDYLDLMADTTSFALAPSVLLYITFRDGLGDPDLGLTLVQGRLLIAIAGGLVITLGVLRLARFCFEQNSCANGEYFTGLPIPATALLVMTMLLMGLPGLVVFGFTFVSASLMVSDLQWPKARGRPGLVVGILGFLMVITILAGEPLELVAEFLMYLTFVGTLMYQYLGAFTKEARARYFPEERAGGEADDEDGGPGDAGGP